jgi:hypothetical protein
LINQLEYYLKKVEPMARLEIFLCGSFQVLVNSLPFTQFESVDLRALSAQLVVVGIHLRPCGSLAALL